MQRYSKYKSTGIDWIGEIPSHWDVMKYRRLFSVSSGDFLTPEIASVDETEFPVYGGNGIRGYANNFNNEGLMLLIGRVGAKCGNIHLAEKKFWVSEHALRVLPKKEFDLEYFRYLLELTNFNQFAITTAQPLINSEIVLDRYAAIPPKEEQTAIANFLDEKTANIDKLISNKQKLIELLKEERTAIINEAVSGEGKDWQRKKLKYVAKLRDELIENSDFKIAVENIESGSGRLVNMQEEKNYEGQLLAFKPGDTIFNKLRPYLHKVYFAEKHGGLYGELLIVYSLGELLPEFLFFKLFSKEFIDIVDGSTQGTKMPRANWNDFISHLPISFPNDRFEQQQIVQYIRSEIKRIYNTVSKIEKEIDLLNEYRTVLISEVVTGKIKVA